MKACPRYTDFLPLASLPRWKERLDRGPRLKGANFPLGVTTLPVMWASHLPSQMSGTRGLAGIALSFISSPRIIHIPHLGGDRKNQDQPDLFSAIPLARVPIDSYDVYRPARVAPENPFRLDCRAFLQR